jgi:hypothetical protein
MRFSEIKQAVNWMMLLLNAGGSRKRKERLNEAIPGFPKLPHVFRWGSWVAFVAELPRHWAGMQEFWRLESSDSPEHPKLVDSLAHGSCAFRQAELVRDLAQYLTPLIQLSESMIPNPVILNVLDMLMDRPAESFPAEFRADLFYIYSGWRRRLESRFAFARSVLWERAWLSPLFTRLFNPSLGNPPAHLRLSRQWQAYTLIIGQLPLQPVNDQPTVDSVVGDALHIEDPSRFWQLHARQLPALIAQFTKNRATVVSNAQVERTISEIKRRYYPYRSLLSMDK